jgi:hypothetical protein
MLHPGAPERSEQSCQTTSISRPRKTNTLAGAHDAVVQMIDRSIVRVC